MSNDNSHHNTVNTVGTHNIKSSNDGHSSNSSKINISQQNQNLQQNNQKMPLSRSLTQPQGTMEYVVTANDTITSVAARFHTTPSELARINRRSGHFIFPGQVLFVPKSLSVDNVEYLDKQQQKSSSVPPNTPNDPLLSQSPSHVIQSSNTNINESNSSPSSSIDNLSPVPGHAERVVDAITNIDIKADNPTTQPLPPSHLFDDKLISIYNQQHHPLNHTASEPVHVIPATPELGAGKEITEMAPTASSSELIQKPHMTSAINTIDPADRECLERFLKINVRYITDGQGVVSGVLLVTPNAMMFDANVSDPLVMEHGPEMYNVTIPIDLVLKTALYSDIAHMRVKHAPEAVPSVPKPSVYYASDEDTSGIVEENLKNVYAKKKTAFDTIGKVSEEKQDYEQQQDELKHEIKTMDAGQISEKNIEKKTSTDDDDEFKDAVEHQINQANYNKNVNNQNTIINNNIANENNNKSCDEVHNKNIISVDNHSNHNETDSDANNKKENEQNNKQPNDSKVIQQADSIKSAQSSSINNADNQQSTEINYDDQLKREGIEEEEEESSSMKCFEENDPNNSQKRSNFKIVESVDDDQATSIDQSLDLMTSLDDNDLLNLSSTLPTPPLSATENKQFQKKQHSPHLAKMSLGERHSAPLQANHHKNLSNRTQIDEHKPLQSAISAEETCSDPSPLRHQRLSAAGENRRGQMLKRLSNPVDALGNLTKSGISSGINATKSGFNATKTGISKGLNATQSGITTGYQATKSGLTTGLSVTKTGFNKVLATPKNLMDFSSGLVRDAKGALAPTASKSDINLQEHLDSSSSGGGSFDESQPQQQSKTKSPMLGYCNMVDTKIDAFENFDKLFPRPARVNKDAPLYLCIRMGKYKKDETKRYQQRFSPTYSFGKKKYEREYWFSVPKDKAKNLYHFFNKWAPEIYGDVDDISGCEQRCLEPITTDDEDDLDEDNNTNDDDNKNNSYGKRRSFQRLSSQDKGSLSLDTSNNDDPNMNANVNRQRFWRRSPLHFLKLVEDHFSTDGLSTEWNVSNSSEDHSFHERYHLEIDNNEPIIPELIGPSELLVLGIIQDLSKHLPARAEGYAWTLIYSTSQHGFSLNSLYREMKHFDSPVLLIVEDTNGAKFGALLSHSLRISDHFYGTGETFLYTFHPTFECFPWTGENIFFIKGNVDSIAIGAGEGNFGLWLDGDLYHGTSHPCKTFGNRSLSSDEDFVVKTIECWGFV